MAINKEILWEMKTPKLNHAGNMDLNDRIYSQNGSRSNLQRIGIIC